MTYGTHTLFWDKQIKAYVHRFCPLIYVFSKEHETYESVCLSMDCLQFVADHFFGVLHSLYISCIC